MDMITQIFLLVIGSVLSGVVGSVGAYIRMKSKQDVIEVEVLNLKTDFEREIERLSDENVRLRGDKKELNSQVHKRIDSLKKTVEKNREHADQSTVDLKQFINDMKIEIIREIHSK